ncbi:flagellar hook-associated protein 3 FlgL [Sphingopyxis sp. YR583]|jgi:flagellar hook-associated protein 3 FlgL|uniref:flagellin N-terminal helical domain-containing protein n=1 Tax=Sphingopyxis sp. YR583 TaxID=1881047 RepID=UPI0008A7A388|nr:flagellin [Sphingopyxis sp. YR583]SEH16335.1 flagellar hook-associated protein 3 FlgL [Sphingopyxis sp. YR583]
MINAVGNRMTREIARQQKLADALERTQIQISGGKKLLRMSDDPVAARRIATIGTTQSSMTAWSSNINSASALVSQADGVMKSVTNLMTRARELTLAASSDTTNPADRATIAAELGTIADELDALAATRDSNGEPVFATGTARVMRFDSDVTFAPVPSAADVFVVGGNSLSTGIRDAATAVAAGDKAGMNASLGALATSIDHVADKHAEIGLAGGRLDRIGDGLELRKITLKDERSDIEDTDLDVAIAELNAQDLTLRAAQAAFAKINSRTLFDILN